MDTARRRRLYISRLFAKGILFDSDTIAEICALFRDSTERDVREDLRAIRKDPPSALAAFHCASTLLTG
jgi:hypothetical protein